MLIVTIQYVSESMNIKSLYNKLLNKTGVIKNNNLSIILKTSKHLTDEYIQIDNLILFQGKIDILEFSVACLPYLILHMHFVYGVTYYLRTHKL
jgi:hypothetical protein